MVPPSVLVVASGPGTGTVLATGVSAAATELRVTHALTVGSAMGVLGTGAFDCVLIGVDSPDAATVDVVHEVRAGAAGAAVVLVVADDAEVTIELEGLADLVLTTHQISGDWLRTLRSTIRHAQVRTALRTAENSLSRLSGIVESVTDAVFTTTVEGTITTWNAGAHQLYGFGAAEVIGADIALLHPAGSDEPRRIIAMVRDGGTVGGLETIRRNRDGRTARVWMSVTPLRGIDGAIAGTVVVARDASDRLELEAELVRQTMHDALTGLPNRAYLTYRLSQALAEAKRRDRPVAVLLLDLDQFKTVDDVHGHLAGDRVLIEIADRLRDSARPTDLVARLGGDEFVVVCPDTDVDAAGRMAERLIAALGAPIPMERGRIQIGTSIGIAVSAMASSDPEGLLKQADAAMHEAKARGRARSEIFDPLLARRADDRRRLAGELREALTHGRLDVYYQPVVDLSTDRVVALEALARWNHPERGAVPPGTFVPLAEEHGFIAEVDRWVLARACQETADGRSSGELPRDVRVAVNLSARSLDDPGLVPMVSEVLRESGLPATALVLEITETALLQNREVARASLVGLRSIGAGVALDDFGTGYSSLSFLRELPVTGVKIDRSFVRDAVERTEDLAITEAIVRLAHGLGLETIAEGVETVEQRDLLRRLGCGSAQGFWWSAAVPMATLALALPGGRAAARIAQTREAGPARFGESPRQLRPPQRRLPEPALIGPNRTACCLRGGIDAGQAWLVVATPARRNTFARALGSLHTTAVMRGQLLELDAYDTMRKMTGPDGGLDPDRFDRVVGPMLQRLGATSADVGVHVELGPVNQPLLSTQVSTDLRRRLQALSPISLEYGDHAGDCSAHGPVPVQRLAVDGSTAS
ncbi:MAG: hypothetical protein JWN91_2385 [Nocardioides sp.]|jgi:diguanylate cyclase (GGDEF)-like protein/PAS domain S-box-containing protein|nr:hypothetical protein [Nocardioides sp.]